MAGLTSASNFLALLDENELEPVKQYALEKLNEVVDQFWPEIADFIPKIEVMFEDKAFGSRKLAALLASKVFYHLNALQEAMQYALGAEDLFDITQKTEFVETITAKCIDEYIRLSVAAIETKNKDEIKPIDPRLTAIAERMFNRCFTDKEFRQAIGIALESRRLDKLEEAIKLSDSVKEMLSYCFDVAMDLVINRDFRQTVLHKLVQLYRDLKVPDYVNMCRCLVYLNDPAQVSQIFNTLLQNGNQDDVLLAYQIAFELCDNASQQFLKGVRDKLPSPAPKDEASASVAAGAQEIEKSADTMEIEASISDEDSYLHNLKVLRQILTGEPTIGFFLEFLYTKNHTDLAILKNIKGSFERNSILHKATIFANALMHAGTTRDTFLRDNLDWLGRATNWDKFSTTAGLGVIHKGHLQEALKVLDPYLPKQGVSASPYSEGGSLFALGIIHANHGEEITKYLLNALRNAGSNETVQHGACLGLGVASMASGNEEVFEALMNVLFEDSAVAGEAAGLAMGLVMLGTSHGGCHQMLNFAQDTQHEKIIRGLALGLALIFYGREEEADTLITTLTMSKDPILRYGGMYMIGLAYCGTGNNKAIRKLLHVAVSDVSDDVRRVAVISLGLILFRTPAQVPKLVSLLAESYNPHVRCGAAYAVGIACSGLGMREAVELLEPLTKDHTDFVRQAALISLAMVLIQISEAQYPKVKEIRQLFKERIEDKHEAVMCKFGAIIASGIIDAGGRNATIGLRSRSGHNNMMAIVGITVFTHFWYWYPLIHFLSLAITPTAIIGVNKELKMPKFKFTSNAKPSTFAYPPDVKPPKEEKVKKLPTAILSISKKQQKREEDKKKKQDEKGTDATKSDDAMDLEKEKLTESSDETATDGKQPDKEEIPPKPIPEPIFEHLENPARVTRQQLKFISFDIDDRYHPVTEEPFGIVLLRDNKPGAPEDIISGQVPSTGNPAPDEDEPQPPEAFEFEG